MFLGFFLSCDLSRQVCSKSLQVFSQANTPMKKWLLDFAFRRKETDLKNGLVRRDSMWDKLIFKKVQVSKTHSSYCFSLH